MKQLMFLISTAGKSKEQIKKEAWEAFLKYQKVEAQVSEEVSQPLLPQVQPNSSATPATTPPVKTPRLSTEEFWKLADTTSQYLGGAIQITNYPHTRKSKSLLSREKLAKRLYQELQARYTSTPTPPMTQKSTKQHPLGLPPTLKEYEQQIRKQSADSSTSEKQTAGQPEAMKTLEVRFVPVKPQAKPNK